jgi:hypothetical protein
MHATMRYTYVMYRTIAATLLLLLPATAASAATCASSDPHITSVVVKGVETVGSVDHYLLSGTVVNMGATAQASNLLQSVVISDADDKLDTKSIPPLKPGESFTFTYVSTRSSQAGKGTTDLGFQLDPISACSVGNDRYTLTF